MPPLLPLSSERLERHGLFLIEDGQIIFLWVGRDAVPQLIQDVFNLPSYEVLRGGKVHPFPIRLQREHTDLLGFIDYITCTRQPVQSAGKCCHSKDKGDASWSVLPPTICCKRRRRAAAKTMGPQLAHPRSCGHITKLPTVHLTVEGQGMAST